MLRKASATWLRQLPRTHLQVSSHRIPCFQLWGCTGLFAAILWGQLGARAVGLSPWIVAGLAVASAVTSLALATITKVIVGEERLTYYHHEIAILSVAGALLVILQQPVLPYLDILLLGIGVFLAFGRIGCFLTGCCHGRPHEKGVAYLPEHAEEGFPAYLVGVRLFPIQLFRVRWGLRHRWRWYLAVTACWPSRRGTGMVLGGLRVGAVWS